jgi:hypothetical protein
MNQEEAADLIRSARKVISARHVILHQTHTLRHFLAWSCNDGFSCLSNFLIDFIATFMH